MDKTQLIKELRRDEGVVPFAYQDHLGYWTIGVGRLIDKKKGGRLRDSEIDFMLSNDIDDFDRQLIDALPWYGRLDGVRQRVLVNMAFNLGVAGLLGFKNTLAMIERGDYAGAAKGMLASKWASQVGDRAKRLATMMERGN
jgi:lysozyme